MTKLEKGKSEEKDKEPEMGEPGENLKRDPKRENLKREYLNNRELEKRGPKMKDSEEEEPEKGKPEEIDCKKRKALNLEKKHLKNET